MFENGARLGHIAQCEVFLDSQRIHVAPQTPVRQNGLELGAEQQGAVIEKRVVQGFDAQSVTRHEEGLLLAVPQGEGEHAAKALDAVDSPRFPGVHDDLGVALGVKHVAQRLQFRNELLVVVDFAIKDHHDRAVFVEQRLLAGRDVNDRQAPMAQAHARLNVQLALVWTTVSLRVIHALEHGATDGTVAAGVKNASDATHDIYECCCWANCTGRWRLNCWSYTDW